MKAHLRENWSEDELKCLEASAKGKATAREIAKALDGPHLIGETHGSITQSFALQRTPELAHCIAPFRTTRAEQENSG